MIKVYTDGSWSPKKKTGGWAFAVIKDDIVIHEASGGAIQTTISEMEMEAIILAFLYCSEHHSGEKVYIYTDSQYTYKGLNFWLKGWQKNRMKTSSGKPVANQQHWNLLWSLAKKNKNIKLFWVKGHKGNVGNEIADCLCSIERKKVEKSFAN